MMLKLCVGLTCCGPWQVENSADIKKPAAKKFKRELAKLRGKGELFS